MPAPYYKVSRADEKIVRPGNPAVTAGCINNKSPDRIFSDLYQVPVGIDIFVARHKDPRCATIITYHLGPVRHGGDDLVGILFTPIAVSSIAGDDKRVAHGRY